MIGRYFRKVVHFSPLRAGCKKEPVFIFGVCPSTCSTCEKGHGNGVQAEMGEPLCVAQLHFWRARLKAGSAPLTKFWHSVGL